MPGQARDVQTAKCSSKEAASSCCFRLISMVARLLTRTKR
jgi:hypothetical protein